MVQGGGRKGVRAGTGRVRRGRRRGGQGGSTKSDGNFKGDTQEVPGYPLHEERGRSGVEPREGPEGGGSGRRRGGQGGFTKLNGNFKGDMHEGLGYPLREERGRLGVDPRSALGQSGGGGPAREASGPGRVGPGRRRGGQGGFTKSDGNFKGDMHEGPGYPQCEERGRLGVDPRPWVKTPQGPKSQPGEGVRAGNARSK